MQSPQKCYKRGGFRRAQVLSVSGHVPASLDHLADQLVLREPHSNAVQGGTSLPAAVSQGMTVAALFNLKDQSALPLQRGCALQELLRNGIAAPGVHVRTPGCELCEMSEGS